MSLKGKVAVVTGASSGIGASIAVTLAKAGAKVAMGARREDRMNELKESIIKDGGQAITVKTDVTNRAEVANLMRRTEAELGPIDILVSNAGAFYMNLVKNLDDKQTNMMIDVNCKGFVNCSAEVVNGMLARKTGHIVVISSDSARKGWQAMSVYTGTKFFVEGFAQSLRKELSKDGIKVTSIMPGFVKTEGFDHSTDKEAIEACGGQSPYAQVMDPVEIANAVVYAVSQAPHVAVNEMMVQTTDEPL